MKKVAMTLCWVLIVFIFFSCKKNKTKYDVGTTSIIKNSFFWECQITATLLHEKKEENYNLGFSNVVVDNNEQKGKILIHNIPFEEGKMSPQSYEWYNSSSIDLSELYIHYHSMDGQDSTPLGYWKLIPDREENHFEITSLSDNHRKVEGAFDLAFTAESDHVKKLTGEPDTLFFSGTFEAKLPK